MNHPATTAGFIQGLVKHVELLRSFPRMGASVRGYPGVRRIVHTPLDVYYRVDENLRLVELLHFWHGSRKDPAL